MWLWVVSLQGPRRLAAPAPPPPYEESGGSHLAQSPFPFLAALSSAPRSFPPLPHTAPPYPRHDTNRQSHPPHLTRAACQSLQLDLRYLPRALPGNGGAPAAPRRPPAACGAAPPATRRRGRAADQAHQPRRPGPPACARARGAAVAVAAAGAGARAAVAARVRGRRGGAARGWRAARGPPARGGDVPGAVVRACGDHRGSRPRSRRRHRRPQQAHARLAWRPWPPPTPARGSPLRRRARPANPSV